MGLEGSSEEGQGMFDPAEEEPLQTSGCCLGEKLQEQVWPTGLCPARGTHTHNLLFLIPSSPKGLRVGTVTAHFFCCLQSRCI